MILTTLGIYIYLCVYICVCMYSHEQKKAQWRSQVQNASNLSALASLFRQFINSLIFKGSDPARQAFRELWSSRVSSHEAVMAQLISGRVALMNPDKP